MKVVYVISVSLLFTAVSAGVVNRKPRVLEGKIQQNGKGPAQRKGQVMFEDELHVDIDLGNGKKSFNLHKQNINTLEGVGVPTSAVYGNQEVVVREECPGDDVESCYRYALVKGEEGTTYISSDGRSLVIPYKGGELSSEILDSLSPNEYDFESEKRHVSIDGLESREKRDTIISDLNASRVVKILMFPDKGVIDEFLQMTSNNLTAAKAEIIKYLTLVCNEMTMHYQTLREYNKTLTVDGVSVGMDVAVTLVGVEFPTDNSNFAWSANNIIGDDIFVYANITSNNKVIYTGVLPDFKSFLASYSTSVIYDHGMAVTGYNYKVVTIKADGTNTTGKYGGNAWSKTMCKQSKRNAGSHSSIVEYNGHLTGIAAHELGHAFGMKHDASNGDSVNCPDGKYMMSYVLPIPKTSIADKYYKFSVCSATNVQSYTAGISASDFFDTCLQPVNQAFTTNFCKGLTGQAVTFDEQCTLLFGPGSVRKTESNSQTEANLQAGYVPKCVRKDDNSEYPFRCSYPGQPNAFYTNPAAFPGTKCLASNGTQNPDNICYNGACQTSLQVCI